MSLTTLPTRGALDLGAALTDERTPIANELSAVHVESLKDRVIQIATDLGIDTTPAAGSVKDRLDDLEAAVDDTLVPTTRSISTTAPITGGGDLSASRTIAISAATTGAAGSMSAADKTKLDGVEALADVTDAANVTAALAGQVVAGTIQRRIAMRTISASGSLTAADQVLLVITTGGAVALTAPSTGHYEPILIKKTNTEANAITVVGTGSSEVEGVAALTPYTLPGSGDASRGAWTLFTDGTDHWVG